VSIYEYLDLREERPTLVRKESVDEAADAFVKAFLSNADTLPLLVAHQALEPPRTRALRWHKLLHWMLEPLSPFPAEIRFVDLPTQIAEMETLLQDITRTATVLMSRALMDGAIEAHRAQLEKLSFTLSERVRFAEAAEFTLWSDVVDGVVDEIASNDDAETDAATFQRAVQRRDWLIATEKWLSSADLATGARGAVVDSNANQYAYQLRQTGQILGVRHQRKRLHPSCQFHDVDGRLEPLPVLHALLKVLPKDDSGWTQAFWLFQPTGRLAKARPADVLATRPKDVLLAAEKDFHGDAGI